jgi:hypothetical protein
MEKQMTQESKAPRHVNIVSRWNAAKVLFEHLVSACKPEGDCIVWAFSLTGDRGRLRIGGERAYAHRAMYALVKGDIPAGQLVRHTCDNGRCINPNHLILGTHAQNMADMVARGRSTRSRKLTLDHRLKVAAALRGRRLSAETCAAISAGVRVARDAKRAGEVQA